MSYETAPATVLVASQCAACARPLVDAVSVETGMGPDCRKKHGYALPDLAVDTLAVVCVLAASLPEDVYLELSAKTALASEARACANVLVHRIACEQDGPLVPAYVAALAKLGFVQLAARIAKRLGGVTVTVEERFLVVRTPFNESFVSAVRGIPGRRFDREGKRNLVPASERTRLWGILKTTFPAGTLVQGPLGFSVL